MRVEVLAVGTELLLGQIVNTNAAHIGARLAEAGFGHFHQAVVGDNLERIADAIRLAAGRSGALIVTGGIGPTPDDVTREALCDAAGVGMAFSEGHADRLRAWWAERGREMPDSNLRQAEHPEGAELLDNPKGTAPGLRMRIGDCWVFAIPGVPQEMRLMLSDHVIPFLLASGDDERTVIRSRVLRTWGDSESHLAEVLGDLFDSGVNPTLAFLASAGEIKLRLTARAPDTERADALIAPLEAEVRRRLGSRVFAVNGETIEALVLDLCRKRGWSIGTAESATGGLLGGRLTSVPGASDTFVGSVVAYDALLKQRLLAVPPEVIAGRGEVSEPVALAMAEGGADVLRAEVCVAVTGSAGPEARGEPVGTMVIAVRTPDDARARTLRLPGDRERVRTYATTSALHLCRLALTGEWWAT